MRATAKRDRGLLVFKSGPNGVVPMQPWPQVFMVTRTLIYSDAVEVRPVTLMAIVKGVGRNFVTMNFWRLCWILRGLGFLKTEEACLYAWGDLTVAFWRYQHVRRFRWVQRVQAADLRTRGSAALRRLLP